MELHLVDDPGGWIGGTQGRQIHLRLGYLLEHPWDIDVLTHELFHVVQDYGQAQYPVWAMEGLADYARHHYGLYNRQAGWSLPTLHPQQHYTDSYRVTARFFVWLQEQHGAGHLESLDRLLRTGDYADGWWLTRFQKTLEQLWSDYQGRPIQSST